VEGPFDLPGGVPSSSPRFSFLGETPPVANLFAFPQTPFFRECPPLSPKALAPPVRLFSWAPTFLNLRFGAAMPGSFPRFPRHVFPCHPRFLPPRPNSPMSTVEESNCWPPAQVIQLAFPPLSGPLFSLAATPLDSQGEADFRGGAHFPCPQPHRGQVSFF